MSASSGAMKISIEAVLNVSMKGGESEYLPIIFKFGNLISFHWNSPWKFNRIRNSFYP